MAHPDVHAELLARSDRLAAMQCAPVEYPVLIEIVPEQRGARYWSFREPQQRETRAAPTAWCRQVDKKRDESVARRPEALRVLDVVTRVICESSGGMGAWGHGGKGAGDSNTSGPSAS